ncbi:Eco57I restriction-modification methylase domain-containing protein [Moraxella nasicaprae]|uniref:Eco57I restriction-modification methylase domain-containing protein n=1 Tax=Moraxella nasicaprae TaxID=2904122 RepID=A0ABY6F6G8_9GAMM|nr:Eco57I restriction-modification methylase domain-containing protein [Moraxella nasicaprae]UXZ05674.1 Eco57I restriction-modification methylase domain-containing protein [Moraxella nasicaprae]
MNVDKTQINTSKLIFPQIYAYALPDVKSKEGWIKIGYTERQDVNTRIKEQVGTVDLDYDLLWHSVARFADNRIFSDHQLHSYLKKYKKIKNKPNTEWFFYNGTPKQSLVDFNDFVAQNFNQENEQLEYQLRQEQSEAVNQTLAYFQNNPNGEFLWNAKPRFGKTLTTYDLIRKLNAKTVLIVTNRPAIAHSWFDDFEKFIAWQSDFAFVSTADTLKERPVLTRDEFLDQTSKPNGKKQMIAFISLQDLKGAICFGGKFDKLEWVKSLQWDLLVIDEAHEGVDTFKTDLAFEQINRDFTLHLSGTPFKALASGQFAQDEIYNWTYADEQKAKSQWCGEAHNPYAALPTLNLFSYQMSQMISDKVGQGADIDGENRDFAFDLNEFFATDDKGYFIHKKEVEKWLNTLSQNEKYPFSTKALRDELKHTFWLLNRVDSAKALAKLLKNHPVFEHYKIVLAAGDGRGDETDVISSTALNRVKKAIKENDKTITLSVGQLTTGVTIPEWTAVLMLSNVKSPALYMQTAFRVQNAWQYEQNGQVYQKKNAYVFDFAPERTLIIYDEFANNLSKNTRGGSGTNQNREENIRELLNFFPVIAEDADGKMIELDVNQVLTIPKIIKANEVVRKGFLSNLLFQNVGRIFGANNEEIRQILEQINPVEAGKMTPNKTNTPIDTQGVQLDENGKALVDNEIVVNTNNARFGEKVYGDIKTATHDIIHTANLDNQNLATQLTDVLTQNTQSAFKDLAKEIGVSEKFAEKVVKEQSKMLVNEVQKLQEYSRIEQNVAKIQFENELKNAKTDDQKQQIQNEYEIKTQSITQDLQNKISETVNIKVAEFTQNSTESILQKAEQNKQDKVEDDMRGRLRGFSRTIPSFLMAYGNEHTRLANFDMHISDRVFKEVTDITIDEFRILRDKHQLFDEQVFDTSVQEFLNKRQALANYFDENQSEDIFDYIPPQKTNQIFTPKWVVKMMMDKFESENPDIFKNPDITFADLYMKSGLYITEIVKRLYQGLKNHIPDDKARLKHIFANQVYGFAPSEIIYNIAKNFILGLDKAGEFDHSHIVHLDTTPYAKGELDFNEKLTEIFGKAMKFDVVVGNPPYQENAKGESTKDTPIYHYFYDLAEKNSDKYCLISPARFLFNAGSTDKNWNEKMLNDKHIKVVYFEQKSENVFANTDIKGGIAILCRDIHQEFGAIGTFTTFNELNTISQKVGKLTKNTLDEIVTNRGQYRYSDKIYRDYPKDMEQISDRRIASNAFVKLPHLFTDEKPDDGEEYIQILGRFENERCFKWFKKAYLSEPENLGSFKVILPKANGSGAIGEVLSTPLIGEPLIGEPLIGYTETFISIGCFNTLLEAENCLKYVKSKFARTMLGVLKITQDNTKEKWSKVPLQDFTENSDIDWSQSIAEIDKQLYAKYGLSDDEIAFIESKVKEMA